MSTDRNFLEKAASWKPDLLKKTILLEGEKRPLGRGDTAVYDFQEHRTGYVSLDLSYEGHHPDAPVWLKLQFAENIRELSEDPDKYHGWISTGWIQQEQIHVDLIPSAVRLPRRYAFRYLKIEVLDISSRFLLRIDRVCCESVTSADEEKLTYPVFRDEELRKIDEVACKTLKECMQDVFEDGPKRDRRLWLGDLRLQALTNSVTYRHFDLVRRCLYLFAGTAAEDGKLAASLFTEPEVEADDSYMLDYSLLYVKALEDHYLATGDEETLRDLWPTAKKQLELAEAYFTEEETIRVPNEMIWCFIDWNLQLDKQMSAHGVWIYCARAAERLAEVLKDEAFRSMIHEKIGQRTQSARQFLDPDSGLFRSGPDRQLSYASQVWAVLGEVTDDPAIFDRLSQYPSQKMVSPYMYHYYAEALLQLGLTEKAEEVIRSYWGGMIRDGADTFWELYDPEDPDTSPYGGTIVNSYCHAWSCTPSYLLRTRLL
ncbi:MAG: cellobiose phosphorylase [Firmicutes bacterium]|nr:cellobiose phosphorylase [Bacillota bacterium]